MTKQKQKIQILVNGSDGSYLTILKEDTIVEFFTEKELKDKLKIRRAKKTYDELLDILKSKCFEQLYPEIPVFINKILSPETESPLSKEIIDQFSTYTIPCNCKPCTKSRKQQPTNTDYILACRCYLCIRGTPNIITNHDISNTNLDTRLLFIKKLLVVSLYTLEKRFEGMVIPKNHGNSDKLFRTYEIYQFILIHKNLLGIGTVEWFNLFKTHFASILNDKDLFDIHLEGVKAFHHLPSSLLQQDPWKLGDDNQFLVILRYTQIEMVSKNQYRQRKKMNKRKKKENQSDRDLKRNKIQNTNYNSTTFTKFKKEDEEEEKENENQPVTNKKRKPISYSFDESDDDVDDNINQSTINDHLIIKCVVDFKNGKE